MGMFPFVVLNSAASSVLGSLCYVSAGLVGFCFLKAVQQAECIRRLQVALLNFREAELGLVATGILKCGVLTFL